MKDLRAAWIARKLPTTDRSWRRLATGLALLLAGAGPAHPFSVDGRFGGASEGYTLGFNVSFRLDDSSTVEGGKLYFGTDTAGDGDHYMYFAMPKDFVDNTWGASSVGGNTNRSFKHLLGSDSLGGDSNRFVLRPVDAGGGTIELQVDYLHTDSKTAPSFYRSGGIGTLELGGEDNTGGWQNDGAVHAVSPGLDPVADKVKQIATSLEYNIGLPGESVVAYDQMADSPNVLRDANGDAVLDADGSYRCDPNGADYARCQEWIFEVGYEFRFDASLFDSAWTNADAHLAGFADSAVAMVDLGESHVSPNKVSASFETISISCDPDPAPGDVGCGPGGGLPPPSGDAVQVPAPGTGALLGIGLVALGLVRPRGRVHALRGPSG